MRSETACWSYGQNALRVNLVRGTVLTMAAAELPSGIQCSYENGASSKI